jgi:hypothetical protein
MIDYKSLLHRYIHHVGREEGAVFIPCVGLNEDWFSQEEIAELDRLDQEAPSPLTPSPNPG